MSGQASQQAPAKPQTPYRKMYYIRVAFGVAAGIICGALNIVGPTGLIVAIAIFILSYLFLRNVTKGLAALVLDKNKFFLSAIFSYFLIWFVVWTITINLLYPKVL
jgi:uncharacterized membrane protein